MRHSPRPSRCAFWVLLENESFGDCPQWQLWHSYPQNFPFERDPACFLDAGADELAQAFEIGGGGLAPIDQKIAMKFGNLCIADGKPTAAGLVDQFPRLLAGGFLKVEPPVRVLTGCVSERAFVISAISAKIVCGLPTVPENTAWVKITSGATAQ